MNNEPLDLNWQNAAELTPPPFRMAEPDADYLTAHRDRCRLCGHSWHGLACRFVSSIPCTCATAFEDAS